MKENNNSSTLLQLLKKVFKSEESDKKGNQRIRERRWMYRNE